MCVGGGLPGLSAPQGGALHMHMYARTLNDTHTHTHMLRVRTRCGQGVRVGVRARGMHGSMSLLLTTLLCCCVARVLAAARPYTLTLLLAGMGPFTLWTWTSTRSWKTCAKSQTRSVNSIRSSLPSSLLKVTGTSNRANPLRNTLNISTLVGSSGQGENTSGCKTRREVGVNVKVDVKTHCQVVIFRNQRNQNNQASVAQL